MPDPTTGRERAEVHGPCGGGEVGDHGGPDDRHCRVCIDRTCRYNQPDQARERVARAIAEAAGDGVFDRDEPDCSSDDEDRDYWLRLADAALTASGRERACGHEWNTEDADPDSWLTDHLCVLTPGHDEPHECECGLTAALTASARGQAAPPDDKWWIGNGGDPFETTPASEGSE